MNQIHAWAEDCGVGSENMGNHLLSDHSTWAACFDPSYLTWFISILTLIYKDFFVNHLKSASGWLLLIGWWVLETVTYFSAPNQIANNDNVTPPVIYNLVTKPCTVKHLKTGAHSLAKMKRKNSKLDLRNPSLLARAKLVTDFCSYMCTWELILSVSIIR